MIKNSRIKILHIFDHTIPLHSGYTFRSISILKEQQKIGWETYHVSSPKQGEYHQKEELVDDFLFYRSDGLKAWQKKIPLLNQWWVVRNLKRRLKEVTAQIRPDIIHAHSPALNGLAALYAGKLFNIPVVYEIRAYWEDAAVDHGTSKEDGIRYKLSKSLETYVIKNVDAITTICEGLRRDIISRNINPEKITVIPNAVNIDSFKIVKNKNTDLEMQYNLTGNKVIGFIGSFYAYEGLTDLLKAFALMKYIEHNIKILLVGGGSDEATLRSLAKELDIEKNIIFTGRIPHNKIQQYYSLVDVLVYPRKSMRLTELVTPLKPLEAMAQKIILVASDVGGHKELIKNDKNGFLFEHGNIQQLADLLGHILTSSNSYEYIKENGRDFVESERNWSISVNNYKQVYYPLLENKA